MDSLLYNIRKIKRIIRHGELYLLDQIQLLINYCKIFIHIYLSKNSLLFIYVSKIKIYIEYFKQIQQT
jgi:hypothetical protein